MLSCFRSGFSFTFKYRFDDVFFITFPRSFVVGYFASKTLVETASVTIRCAKNAHGAASSALESYEITKVM